MTVGELFVNLGIKGTDKTVSALTSVKKGMGDVASMSLEAKAGILAALYALERLGSASNQAGTGLTNFQATTGLSLEMLQRYQYAGQQAGATNEEVAGSFRTLQQSMDAIARGEGAPQSLQYIADAVGGIDFEKASKDAQYLFDQLTKFSQLQNIPAARKNWALGAMGDSANMIAARERNKFTPEIMARAPIYGQREAAQLDKNRAAVANLMSTIEHAIGHLNAKFGGELIKNITALLGPIEKLVGAFIKLAEVIHPLMILGKSMEGWAGFLNGTADAVNGLTDAIHDPKKRQALEKKIQGTWTNQGLILKEMAKELIHPSGGQQNNINQNLHFHGNDGTEHRKIAPSHKQAANDAFRQIPAGQWS